MSSRTLRVLLPVLLVVGLLLTGCGGNSASEETSEQRAQTARPDASLSVTGAWMRPAPASGRSALYLTVVNGTSRPDTLQAATVPGVGRVEIHESSETEAGTIQMREIGPLPVPPKSRVTLEPGAKHIMLMDLQEPIALNDTVQVDLQFTRKGLLRVGAPVRNIPPQ